MLRFAASFCAIAVASILAGASPVPKSKPGQKDPAPNSNALVKKYRDRLAFARSSDWQGWPPEKAFDDNPDTSWFSATGDTPTGDKMPWIAATFPEDVAVRRVTILGNREPNYPAGYSVLAGKLELLDEKGKVLESKELKAAGEKYDFDFVISAGGVRAIKFTITDDQGNKNGSQDCALAEIEVE